MNSFFPTLIRAGVHIYIGPIVIVSQPTVHGTSMCIFSVSIPFPFSAPHPQPTPLYNMSSIKSIPLKSARWQSAFKESIKPQTGCKKVSDPI